MNARLLVLLFSLVTWQAAAHEFWIQPQSFELAPGVATGLSLQVGHGADRQVSPIAMRRILRFDAVGDGTQDLRVSLAAGWLRFDAPGSRLLVLQTDDRAQTLLPALRFNDYLESEGLAEALALRARAQRSQAPGAERYSRIAKAILRVGDGHAASPHVTQATGLKLEIVPERDPSLPSSSVLPVQVLWRGAPLAGALVKLTDLANDAQPLATRRTGADGRALFAPLPAGQYLFNVVWTEPDESGEVDFATIFSSLSFAVPSRGR